MIAQSGRVLFFTGKRSLVPPALRGRNESHAGQGDSPVGHRKRASATLREVRIGRGLMKMTHLREIIILVWLKREAILKLPRSLIFAPL